MKLTIHKTKNTFHFYVQKSVRKSNGSVSSFTVEKLGNLSQVKTRANGEDPFVWAKNYVDELNRREYEEKKEIIIPYSPSKLVSKDEQKLFNCGYLFLQQIYYSLGLDKICEDISSRYKFDYDISDILSKLIYTRILYPSSKLSSYKQAHKLIEQPKFKIHDIYRALVVLSKESDFIQAQLYKNRQKVFKTRKDILYYDCTNYFFELEEADELRRYGKSKQHQPLPIVGMGLFMDYSGTPLAFDIFPGDSNEQPTLKPLEQKVIKDYNLESLIVCTDAGLSSKANRRFNNLSLNGVHVRSFITTQSIRQLPEYLKKFALDPDGWHILGLEETFNINEIDEEQYFDKIFYKDRWIKEDISKKKVKNGEKPLEQHLIVSFSPKYKNYERKIRKKQIERAQKIIDKGDYSRRSQNQNDPRRFIEIDKITKEGELCSKEIAYIDKSAILEEERYDGFYAVCTNLDNIGIDEIIKINKKRWEIEECFRIMKTEFKARPVYLQREEGIRGHFLTCFIALIIYRILENKLHGKYTCESIIDTLKNMDVFSPIEKMGYTPVYTRTDVTDELHETAGFRTDYQIINNMSMKRIIKRTKGKK